MSKIEQAVTFINRFLSGSDQSDSPAMRQAVTHYAAACAEVNKDLQHCRKLIDSGLLTDARIYADSMQPDLSSRCSSLFLPADKIKRLCELCVFYNYEQPQALDLETFDKLNKSDDSSSAAIQELLRRWRKCARTAGNIEKIRILRAILASNPADKQIWRSNLLAVEKQFTAELFAEAEKALQSKDYSKLNDLFAAMSSPELLNPPAPAQLEKFRPAVIEYQQQQLAGELESKRCELFAAYSSLNQELTRRLLSEYDNLCTNPLYTPDREADQAVSEVRCYLAEIDAARRKQQEFDRLHSELIAAIEQRKSFPEIENIYAALRRTDLPVDMVLSKRMEFLQQEYLSEKNRTHIRKCVYGVSLALLLAGLGLMIFILLQSYRSSRSYCETMERLIAAGNYQAVQELHTKISAESPMLLKFGRLNGLMLESLRLEKERNERFNRISNLLSQCEAQLSSSKVQLAELQHHIKNIDEEKHDDLPENSAQRLQKVRFEIRKLQLQNQQQAEQKFLTSLRQLNGKLDLLDRQLQTNSIELKNAEKEITAADRSAAMLFAKPGDAADKLIQSSRRIFQERLTSIRERVEQMKKIRQLEKTLLAPANIEQYTSTLEKLPTSAPLLADGIWRDALRNLPRTRMLINSTALSSAIKNTGDLAEVCSKYNIDMNNSPAAEDLRSSLPGDNLPELLKTFVLRMKNNYTALYDCRELVLRTFDNKLYRFYTTDEPVVEKSRTSRIPKAIGINVMLMPGTAGKFLPFKFTRMGEKVIIYPGNIENINMPKYFTGAENIPLTAPFIPEAAHSVFLKSLLRNLNSTVDSQLLESLVIKELQTLKLANNMNIFARAALTSELLKLAAEAAPLSSDWTTAELNFLAPFCQNYASRWYEADAEIKYSAAANELKEFFGRFDPLKQQKAYRFLQQLYHTNVSRGLVPGGVVLQKSDKKFTVHSFQEVPNPHELWIFSNGKNNQPSGWMVFSPEAVSSDAAVQPHLYHGAVFFVPLDGRNTAELADALKKQASQLDIANFIWPQNWPLNCRGTGN